MSAILEVSGLSKSFSGLHALSDVGFVVEEGPILGIIGPNGAGKTTLFNVVCGFLQPDEGRLTWRGEVLRGLRPHQLAGLGISRTLQGVGLFAGLTVLENVVTGLQTHARSGFLSAFFAVVGCHGAHVTVGLLWLGTMMAQIWFKGFNRHTEHRLLCFNLFWHALDIIWVALFTVVYLFGVRA